MDKDKALKLALEALESDYAFEWPAMRRPLRSEKKRLDAITAIGVALAQPPLPVQPVQEPFGYFRLEPFGWTDCAETDEAARALYEAPFRPEERNFCPRCGKRTADLTTIHTCTPPEGGHQ